MDNSAYTQLSMCTYPIFLALAIKNLHIINLYDVENCNIYKKCKYLYIILVEIMKMYKFS